MGVCLCVCEYVSVGEGVSGGCALKDNNNDNHMIKNILYNTKNNTNHKLFTSNTYGRVIEG